MATTINGEQNKTAHAIAPFCVRNGGIQPNGLTPIYEKSDGTTVLAGWGKDSGTMERKLVLSVAYSDGEVSPIHEYSPSKLVSSSVDKPPAVLNELANLAGITTLDISPIYKGIIDNKDNLHTQSIGGEKCSITQALQELSKYVDNYKEPGKVFVQGDYGNIEYTYMPTVLDKLSLGYSRLELSRNFQMWKLLRSNAGTGHAYTYKIKKSWYFSFRLADVGGAKGGDVE